MIPQVTIVWAQRQAKCRFCHEPIDAATPEVSAVYPGKDGKWTAKHKYHPTCWIQKGLEYLKAHPYETPKEKVELTDEQLEQRYKILHKYASLKQRQRNLDVADDRYTVKNANIEGQLAQLIMDILPLGGVPKKWMSNDTPNANIDGSPRNN